MNVKSRARVGRLISVVATAGLLAAACSSATDQVDRSSAETNPEGQLRLDYVLDQPSDPQPGGSLVFGIGDEGDGWHPSVNRWAGASYTVGKAVFDPLMEYDENLDLQPYLAESVTSNEDFTVWTITLRPGVVFHDGTPLTAEVLADNFESNRNGLPASALAFIDALEVTGDLTLEVRMSEPWSTFPTSLTSQIGFIMAPSMLDNPEEGSRAPVGTGPFSMEEWRVDESLTMEKNPDYWRDGLPYLDDVEFRVTIDVQTRTRGLTTGNTDVIETADAIQLDQLARAAGRGEIQLYTDSNSESSEIFVAFNMDPDSESPFRDGQPGDAGQIARDAVAWGVDRDGLSQAAFAGVFPPAFGPHQEGSFWYVDVPERPTYDIDKAKDLAAQYQELTGEPLSFEANITPTPEIQNIAQTLQQQAQEAGIDVQLVTLDQTKLIEDVVINKDYDATGFILFGAPTLERDSVFFADLPEDNFLNFTSNKNPAIVEALREVRSTDDPEAQKEAFGKVQAEMAKDNNFVFLVAQLTAIGFQTNVFGLADIELPDGGQAARTVNPFLTETWVQR